MVQILTDLAGTGRLKSSLASLKAQFIFSPCLHKQIRLKIEFNYTEQQLLENSTDTTFPISNSIVPVTMKEL